MLTLILALAVGQVPPTPKFAPVKDLCACADCKCKTPLPKQTVEPPVIKPLVKAPALPPLPDPVPGATYELRAGAWVRVPTPRAAPTLSSGCPGGVCPIPTTKGWGWR